MPAVSKNMRRAMAIAEHHPEKLYSRNKAMLAMKKSTLHDFASTPEKGLPKSTGYRDKIRKLMEKRRGK
ncbi:MAG: hypothetical protein KJ556_20825 [Gammaproteobacteria bacterium]|nr:hypothetical protein [Gammaproteobacteria bacterium]